MPDVIQIYNTYVGGRQTYLQNSEAVSRLTIPDITDERYASHYMIANTIPRSPYSTNTSNTDGIYNNSGSLAISGLAASLHRVIFPNQADWFRLSLDEKMTQTLLGQGIQQTDIDSALMLKTKSVKRALANMNFQSAIGRIFQRILIEDNCVVVVTPEALRAIPMRNAMIRRENGKMRYVGWHEEIVGDNGMPTKMYYLADYSSGICWQQREGAQKATRVSDLNPNRVFVVTSHTPDWGSYVTSYGFKHYGTIYTLNNLSYNLLRAASIASKSIMVIDPNSGLTPQQIAGLQGGSCIVGEASAVQWISSAMKINDWAWTQNYIAELQMRLNRAFALDLLNMQFQQPRTATEIQAVTAQIDSQVASLASSISDSFAKPLVGAILDILAENEGGADLLANLRPVITSGTSAFDSLVEYQKLLQGLAAVSQFDPTLAQRIDSIKLLQTFSNATGINTDEFIREAPAQMAVQQPSYAPAQTAAFLPPQQQGF